MRRFPVYQLFNPIFLFLSVWLLQVGLYFAKISEFIIIDEDSTKSIAEIFVFSLVSFLFGCSIAVLLHALYHRFLPTVKASELDLARLRVVIKAIFFAVLLLTIFNWLQIGPPPLVNILTDQTANYTYLNYGKMMYVLYALIMLAVLLSAFEVSTRRILLVIGISIVFFATFMSRGFMIIALLQFLIARFRIRDTSLTIKGTLLYMVVPSIALFTVMGILGEVRTGREAFLEAMQIRAEWSNLPVGLVWTLSYVALPLSNMISVYQNLDFHTGGTITLASVTPPFLWSYLGLENRWYYMDPIVKSYFPNPINNVPTYNGTVYMDFGMLGIILINLSLGLLSTFFFFLYRRGILHGALFYPTLGSIIFTACFENFLLNLTILTLLAVTFAVIPFIRSKKTKGARAREAG